MTTYKEIPTVRFDALQYVDSPEGKDAIVAFVGGVNFVVELPEGLEVSTPTMPPASIVVAPDDWIVWRHEAPEQWWTLTDEEFTTQYETA